jgi:hypothetical protein
MTVTALSNPSAELPVDGVWMIVVDVRDANRCLTDDASPVVTVTLPGGTTDTPTVERLTLGTYRAVYTVTTTGRYVASAVAAGYGAADFTAFVAAIVPAGGMPILDDLRGDLDDADDFGYLGRTSATDAQIQDALDAEAANQRKVCRVPAAFGADLRQALMRRVARNLAMQRIPLAVLQGDADTGSTVPPGSDPEVRRFERAYRRLPMG